MFTSGADDGVDGRVVIAPGDILLPFKVYVQAPIELAIERGRIQEIRGGVEAELVREYMANFDDPDAYGRRRFIGFAPSRCAAVMKAST